MRTLVAMRGAPGSGKSTLINELGLSQYSLSADDIRILFQSPILNKDGSFGICQKNDRMVWELLYKILEQRMIRGEFVVLDACFSKEGDFSQIKKLADIYRYRTFVMDLSHVPASVCKEQNLKRPEYKRVPDDVIDKMAARYIGVKPPKYMKPFEKEMLQNKVFDFNEYENVYIVGDVHGCFTALKKFYEKYKPTNKDCVISVGDLFDKGVENAETAFFVKQLLEDENQNFMFLASNHGKWFNYWAFGQDDLIKSRGFKNKTVPQFEAAGFNQEMARSIARREAQFAHFIFAGNEYFVNHGGSPVLPEKIQLIALCELENGIGEYSEVDDICDSWNANTKKNQFQIFGHRSCEDNAQTQRGRCFRLESQIELGGNLSVIKLSSNGGQEVIKIKNDVFDKKRMEKYIIKKQGTVYPEGKKPETVEDLVNYFRSVDDVEERVVGGNIHSFNFKRSVFNKKTWNEMNSKARGLFIKVDSEKFGFKPYIVARGYDKFFNYGEKEETSDRALEKGLKFPLSVYEKENGHLGLLGYDEEDDELVFCSKSKLDSDHAIWFKEIFLNKVSLENQEKIKNLLKTKNVCMVFECIDIKNDPHIIKYEENSIILLDIFYRIIEEKRFSYETLSNIAQEVGVPVKKKVVELATFKEFKEFLQSSYLKTEIEGVVIEDDDDYKIKCKTPFYSLWKKLRGILGKIVKGQGVNVSKLYTPIENQFYSWLKNRTIEMDQDEKKKFVDKGIIWLRDQFLLTNKK